MSLRSMGTTSLKQIWDFRISRWFCFSGKLASYSSMPMVSSMASS